MSRSWGQLLFTGLAVLSLAQADSSSLTNTTAPVLDTTTSSLSFSLGSSSSNTAATTLATSVSSSLGSSSTTAATTPATTGSSSTTATTTTSVSATAVTVDAAGGAQFTAINDAISYAQTFAYPTVIINAGTYNEKVVVQGTSNLAVIGASDSSDDYSKNKVTISSNLIPMSISSDSSTGVSWRNINFINPGPVVGSTTAYPAVSLRGTRNAFYNCQLVSVGEQAVQSTLALALIANSYVEGANKLLYGYLGVYMYGSTMAATANNAVFVYGSGYQVTDLPYQQSLVAIDSSNVTSKTGTSIASCYLASVNGVGLNVVYKHSSIAGIMASGGTKAAGSAFFGEYATTGAGSYSMRSGTQADVLMTDSQLSNWTIDYVFANSFIKSKQTELSWIDSTVVASISKANSAVASSSTSATTSLTSPSSVQPTDSTSTVTSSSSSATSSSSLSTSSASSTTGCVLPTYVPSTAKVVGPSGSCANYTSVGAAVNDLPADSTSQYIYILRGTYTEPSQISISRKGATVFRGESNSTLSQASNGVTIQYSGSLLSSAGTAEPYAVFRSNTYSATKYAFYNVNFVNTATIATNYVAIAMDIKAQQVGFYSCGFVSGGGTFLANYGTFYCSGCYVEGSKDFIWGYGAAYFSNSKIVSNTPGYSIAAQNYNAAYLSQFVFDQCAFVPKTTTSMASSTYLGRDYSNSSRVAITNSFLDGHINPLGWTVASTPSNVTFAEYNNTGPGADTTSRYSRTQVLTDATSYSASNVLGSDLSWIDNSAIVPFSGFPVSLFSSSTSSSTSSAASSSATATALSASSTYIVSLTPNSTEYGSVSAAVNALPNDGLEKTIIVMPGTYTEQININRTGKVNLRGYTDAGSEYDYSKNQVTIQFQYGVSTSAGQDELTPVLNTKKTDSSGIAIYNINFVNTFAQTKNYAALAADFYGPNMAAYGCKFVGFQDTLLANQGTQLFSNCYIEGSVDFIWGYSKAYFRQCYIASNTAGGASIAAQARTSATASGGYVFDSCMVTYTSTYGTSMGLTYLGRPYSNYSVAVYKNSYLDQNINSAGWSVWQTSNPQTSNVMFGEYNNVGPSAWTSTTTRASFATNLTDTQVASYDLATFLGSTSWIDTTAYGYSAPFVFPNTTATTSTTVATANATTSRPTSGTTPPTGAVLVSVDGAVAGSYPNLTIALSKLPADSTSQTIFVYPGSYYEQFQINRSGPVTIIGYQSGNVGEGYSENEVTITYARGLSVVAPIPSGHTDAETAVLATASNQITVYNIDFINTDNADGLTASYVTLAASIYGDKIGFYGCSFVGWQDTLLTGNPAGYAYYESSYIEGAIDFIWGYSMSYFKGCTIAAKKAKSCFTAQSRASSAAVGGYVFDQCLFTAAASISADLTSLVYLGRPYSKYAKVVIKYSYLDDVIAPAGWKAWSTTDPRLDNVFFGEYQNTGPGNWENNSAARVAFGNCTLLTADTYTLSSVMSSTSWIDMTYWNSIVTPSPAVVTSPVTTNTTTVANSTSPASGACIVSKTTIDGTTSYQTIQECINLLPTGSAVANIFIYPGTYNEQLTFNRSGATVFRGYADTPDSYGSNQVIITNSNGVDTQGDASNSDSATFYSRGKNVKFYNINLINTFGTASDYASLGFAIGNNGNASFYGCQIIGNQDTLNINTGCSVFAYNTYVEGSVDFIWGSGSGYFLASTISPNTNGVSITADKRALNTSIGGIVFDQCKVTPSAAGASVSGMTGSISLGRPWNANARVAYIQTYLDSCVSDAGWNQWSTSSPQTDGVFFGEYQNTGPGASSASRATFSHQMTSDEASAFELNTFFSSTTWIDFTALAISPFSPDISLVVITSTVTPTGPPATTTVTSTQTSILTSAASTSVSTKNIIEKITEITTVTGSDVYKTFTAITTLTSFDTVTPVAKTVYSTINEISSGTLTISGDTVFTTSIVTIKVTDTTTSTRAPVTKFQTVTESDIQTISASPITKLQTTTQTTSQTVTPSPVTVLQTIVETSVQTVTPAPVTKAVTIRTSDIQSLTITAAPVVQTITTFENVATISTSTPKIVTTNLKTTTTVTIQKTAVVPTINDISYITNVVSNIKTITPKGLTVTSTDTVSVGPGPTVTSTAKSVSTVLVYSTSTVFTTHKITTQLSCIAQPTKRDIQARYLEARSSMTANASTTTITVTLPLSTSTFVVSAFATSTKAVSVAKSTEIDTFTSYAYQTVAIPGSTISTTIPATRVVSKTTTIPQSTEYSISYLQGTVLKTTSLKASTSVIASTITTTAKTQVITLAADTSLSTITVTHAQTTTLPAESIQSTTTVIKSQTVTLPAETVQNTVTSTRAQFVTLATQTIPSTVVQTISAATTVTLAPDTIFTTVTSTKTSSGVTVLPASTLTISSAVVRSVTATTTPEAVTVSQTSTINTTVKATTTLPQATITAWKTITSSQSAPTVMVTKTTTKIAKVKTTSTIFTTITKTAKHLATCA